MFQLSAKAIPPQLSSLAEAGVSQVFYRIDRTTRAKRLKYGVMILGICLSLPFINFSKIGALFGVRPSIDLTFIHPTIALEVTPSLQVNMAERLEVSLESVPEASVKTWKFDPSLVQQIVPKAQFGKPEIVSGKLAGIVDGKPNGNVQKLDVLPGMEKTSAQAITFAQRDVLLGQLSNEASAGYESTIQLKGIVGKQQGGYRPPFHLVLPLFAGQHHVAGGEVELTLPITDSFDSPRLYIYQKEESSEELVPLEIHSTKLAETEEATLSMKSSLLKNPGKRTLTIEGLSKGAYQELFLHALWFPSK